MIQKIYILGAKLPSSFISGIGIGSLSIFQSINKGKNSNLDFLCCLLTPIYFTIYSVSHLFFTLQVIFNSQGARTKWAKKTNRTKMTKAKGNSRTKRAKHTKSKGESREKKQEQQGKRKKAGKSSGIQLERPWTDLCIHQQV